VHRIGTDSDPTELFETAAALGATAVLVVSDLADLAATTSELERLVLHADRLGLAVGLEYMAWTTPSTAGDALAVARRTGCRLVVDVLHHHRTGAGAAALREIVDAGVLGWLQLCDAPAAAADDLLYEARHDRLPPGHGELPLAALLGELPADVTISVEVQSDHLAGAHDALARARLLHTRAVRALNHRA